MWSFIAKKISEPVAVSEAVLEPNLDCNIQLYVNVYGKPVSVCKRRLFIISGTPNEDSMREFIKDAPYADLWTIHITKQASETYNKHCLPVFKVILSLKNGVQGIPIVDSKTQRTLGVIPRVDTLSKDDVIDYLHLFDLFELGNDDEPAHVQMNEWQNLPKKLIVDGFKPFRLITVLAN
jgi:hypothetical protein